MNLSNLLLQADPDRRFLFADEKINTVIVVIMAIFVGLVAYMVLTGRKVKRLETELATFKAKQKTTKQSAGTGKSIEIKKQSK